MSTKTIAQKLFLKDGYKFIIINEPDYYREVLGILPQKIKLSKILSKNADVIQYFVKSKAVLLNDLPKLKLNLHDNGYLWISYPKGTSGVVTDLNRDIIINILEENGFKSVTLISIDDVWTSLRCKKLES